MINGHRPRPDQDAVFALVMAVADGSLDEVAEIAAQLEKSLL